MQRSDGTLVSRSLQSRLYTAFTEVGATLLGILITDERDACGGNVTQRQCVNRISSCQNNLPEGQTALELSPVSPYLTTGHDPY
jgi:hypothetical protein